MIVRSTRAHACGSAPVLFHTAHLIESTCVLLLHQLELVVTYLVENDKSVVPYLIDYQSHWCYFDLLPLGTTV